MDLIDSVAVAAWTSSTRTDWLVYHQKMDWDDENVEYDDCLDWDKSYRHRQYSSEDDELNDDDDNDNED